MRKDIWGGIWRIFSGLCGLALAIGFAFVTWPEINTHWTMPYSSENFVSIFGTIILMVGFSVWAIIRGIHHLQGTHRYPEVK